MTYALDLLFVLVAGLLGGLAIVLTAKGLAQ